MKAILALNAGSSSLKFAVYEARMSGPVLLFKGMSDRQTDDARFVIKDALGKPVQDDRLSPSKPQADLAIGLLQRIQQLPGVDELVTVATGSFMGGQTFQRRS